MTAVPIYTEALELCATVPAHVFASKDIRPHVWFNLELVVTKSLDLVQLSQLQQGEHPVEGVYATCMLAEIRLGPMGPTAKVMITRHPEEFLKIPAAFSRQQKTTIRAMWDDGTLVDWMDRGCPDG